MEGERERDGERDRERDGKKCGVAVVCVCVCVWVCAFTKNGSIKCFLPSLPSTSAERVFLIIEHKVYLIETFKLA